MVRATRGKDVLQKAKDCLSKARTVDEFSGSCSAIDVWFDAATNSAGNWEIGTLDKLYIAT